MANLENSESAPASQKTVVAGLPGRWRPIDNLLLNMAPRAQLVIVLCSAIFIAAAVSHFAARWLGLPMPAPVYRRIGPHGGPQVFCAGSSLLQFGLSWPEISEAIGQGIESWGVGGSTPSEWELSQSVAINTNFMIIGVSVYDLNEQHLCDARADLVPIMQTIQDLRQTDADWELANRSLSQYPLSWLRHLFPTAGKSDAVLIGLRRKLPRRLRSSAAAEDEANSLVVPRRAVMDFGGSSAKVSDWPQSKTIRRLASMRNENRGIHAFNGLKKLAFERMLLRAQEKGRVIVVVLPVSPAYSHEFLMPVGVRTFQTALMDAQHVDPHAQFVRLDEVAALNSNEYYSDLVHLNDGGRQIATNTFLTWLRQHPSER